MAALAGGVAVFDSGIRVRYRAPPMPIYALGDLTPRIDGDAFVHPDAVIIGDVTIGAQSSVWPGAVLRGDGGSIRIGARTSVQDNAVLHTTDEWPTVVGDDCILGHQIHLEGCTIRDEVLVGNAAMVLHRCTVGPRAVVGANSVVLNDTDVPEGALAVGTPAVVKPGRARAEETLDGVQEYLARAERFRRELRRLE